MSVQVKKFKSQDGFETAGFNVSNGNLFANTVNANRLEINGIELFRKNGDTAISLLTNLSYLELNSVVLNGNLNVGNVNSYLVVANGIVTIASNITDIPGNMDNMAIGQTTPAQANFTVLRADSGVISIIESDEAEIQDLTATNATVTNLTVTNLDVANIGAGSPSAGTFTTITTDDIIINNQPTLISHGTRKDYVDQTAAALAIALGG
jgi:hypothetical protein